jgi:hypothetical protein
MDPTRKAGVRMRDSLVHSQLFDRKAQIRDLDRAGALEGIKPERRVFAITIRETSTTTIRRKERVSTASKNISIIFRALPLEKSLTEAMRGGTAAKLLKLDS